MPSSEGPLHAPFGHQAACSANTRAERFWSSCHGIGPTSRRVGTSAGFIEREAECQAQQAHPLRLAGKKWLGKRMDTDDSDGVNARSGSEARNF